MLYIPVVRMLDYGAERTAFEFCLMQFLPHQAFLYVKENSCRKIQAQKPQFIIA